MCLPVFWVSRPTLRCHFFSSLCWDSSSIESLAVHWRENNYHKVAQRYRETHDLLPSYSLLFSLVCKSLQPQQHFYSVHVLRSIVSVSCGLVVLKQLTTPLSDDPWCSSTNWEVRDGEFPMCCQVKCKITFGNYCKAVHKIHYLKAEIKM